MPCLLDSNYEEDVDFHWFLLYGDEWPHFSERNSVPSKPKADLSTEVCPTSSLNVSSSTDAAAIGSFPPYPTSVADFDDVAKIDEVEDDGAEANIIADEADVAKGCETDTLIATSLPPCPQRILQPPPLSSPVAAAMVAKPPYFAPVNGQCPRAFLPPAPMVFAPRMPLYSAYPPMVQPMMPHPEQIVHFPLHMDPLALNGQFPTAYNGDYKPPMMSTSPVMLAPTRGPLVPNATVMTQQPPVYQSSYQPAYPSDPSSECFDSTNDAPSEDDPETETSPQPIKRRRPKRKVNRAESVEGPVSLPRGFDRVLEKASVNVNVNVPTEGAEGDDVDWEPPRRRDFRRCETKVMLQSADGHLFNKYFEEDDIRDFARRFKTLRCEYGFSQADVGSALGRRYGSDFSQTTISRFEGLVLSHSNMCKLRPPVEQWLADIQDSLQRGITIEQLRRACKNGEFWPSTTPVPSTTNLVPPLRKRRKRTSFDASQRLALESYFLVNARPDNAQMVEISRMLQLDFEVVRVWFCNSRQKQKRSSTSHEDRFSD